jgi:hypothetical protein
MTPEKHDVLFYALAFGLFSIAVFVGFQRYEKTSAGFVIAAGLSSIVFRHQMARAQRRINPFPKPFESARPTTFVLWGIGLLVLGLAWLVNP